MGMSSFFNVLSNWIVNRKEMRHKYWLTRYVYGDKEVLTVEVYDPPLILGAHLFWYCVSVKNSSLLVIKDKFLFPTIEACMKAEKERAKGMKEFFDTFPSNKKKEG